MQNRRVAVRGVVLQDNKILVVRLKQYKGRATDDGKNYWCTPGGGVDYGEPLEQALEREMVEETGIKPSIGNLLYIQQFEHNDWEHLEFFFHITNAMDYQTIDLNQASHGAIEIAEISFIDPQGQTLLPVFLTQQDLAKDAAAGLTQVFNYIAS